MRQWLHSATHFLARSTVIARPAPQRAAHIETTEALSWAEFLIAIWRLAVFLLWDVAAPLVIFLIAYTPRWALARSLDLITDESVYIQNGSRDYSLFINGDFTNSYWINNREAPPFPKILMGAGSVWGAHVWALSGWLYGARLPGVILSSAFLVVAYWLARPIFGKLPATLGALVLALSPWLAYFAAIAYLDTYMVTFASLAILVTWHAVRHPRWLPLVGALLGLAFVSKYTAAFAGLPIILYLTYYYLFVEHKRPPWQLWLAIGALLGAIYLADPEIWINPISRLWNSMLFEYDHAIHGHGVYWNGRIWEHVPPGEAIYILLAKMSLFIVIPALLALPWAFWRFVRTMRARWSNRDYTPTQIDDRAAFALFWLGGLLVPLSLLTIVVGTHYILPLAPPVAFVGAWALVRGCEWLVARLSSADLSGVHGVTAEASTGADDQAAPQARWANFGAQLSRAVNAFLGELTDVPGETVKRVAYDAKSFNKPDGIVKRRALWRVLGLQALTLALLVGIGLALTLPPAHGLSSVSQAEGYTSEWMTGENQSLQVAYPAYAEGVDWVAAHTKGRTSVTVVGASGSLDYWMQHRQNIFPQRIRLLEGNVCEIDAPTPPQSHCGVPDAMYIILPMHLVQRQQLFPVHLVEGQQTFPLPANWRTHVVATITGGNTIYCYILHMHN